MYVGEKEREREGGRMMKKDEMRERKEGEMKERRVYEVRYFCLRFSNTPFCSHVCCCHAALSLLSILLPLLPLQQAC